MIDVTITRNETGLIRSFSISGHAFFAERGKDIVCAGASAVSIGAINAIHEMTGVVPLTEIDYDEGLLRCEIQDNLPAQEREKIQVLLEGMYFQLKTIEEEYGQHIRITFKNQEVE
ncbi:ribosomal-processing cysteine protease Prp [Neobacillus notoginsengisoli]|uniref:Ribosomal processing cysteine protease Prp n=1 Tax=Neobacillus notoginsengisoli TaxID=1578198 RepID=A0A417YTX3_9BACI|nr:ribosomal-processing cysteine protease Prp [Neobacillus notoginsengisoli]RHW40626.1 ribosomal-processing cysteine protease Prp [Neobacillus notoginsengisoli]